MTSLSPSVSRDISRQTWEVAEGILKELDKLESSGESSHIAPQIAKDRENLRNLLHAHRSLSEKEKVANATLAGLVLEITLYKHKIEKLTRLEKEGKIQVPR
ncbi:hypothetical protein RCL1_007386 [Eukaryota sp. TZLM3-RCL]